MSMPAGRPVYIEQNMVDGLAIRLLLDDQTGPTLAGTQYITITGPGGTELVARTSSGITISGVEATYTQTWVDTSYGRDHGYKAAWELTDGATVYKREQWFSVVRRRFRSSLTDADITAIHPYITNQNQQANLSLYKQEAWEEIERMAGARIPTSAKRSSFVRDYRGGSRIDDYPGNFFYPSTFRQCHLWLTLSWFMEHNAFGNADQNEARAEKYRARALDAFDLALQKVAFDRDDDGLEDSWEESFDFGTVRIDR